MARGRKADPPAVKAAKGNTRRQRKVDPASIAEPAPIAGRLPAWLQTKKRVRKVAADRATNLTGEVWAFLQPELTRLNLLRATDEHALGRFCRYMAEWVIFTEIIDREGAYYLTESPHVKDLRRPHPAWRARKDVEHALKDLGDSIGLTPASRQRLMMALANSTMLPAAGGADRAPASSEPEMFPEAVPPSPVGLLN